MLTTVIAVVRRFVERLHKRVQAELTPQPGALPRHGHCGAGVCAKEARVDDFGARKSTTGALKNDVQRKRTLLRFRAHRVREVPRQATAVVISAMACSSSALTS